MRPHLFDSNSKSPADLAVQRGQIDVGILVDVLLHFEIAFSPLTAKKLDKLLRHKMTFEGRTIQYSVNKYWNCPLNEFDILELKPQY